MTYTNPNAEWNWPIPLIMLSVNDLYHLAGLLSQISLQIFSGGESICVQAI